MTRSLLVALTLCLGACSPASVRGQIDGDNVGGARSAFFDTVDFDFGVLGSIEYVVVAITDLPNGCDVLEDLYTTVEPTCDDVCDAYIDIVEDNKIKQDDYFILWMVANTEDGDEGEFDFDEELGDEEFTASYSAFDAAPLYDAGDCEDECEDGDLLDADIEDGKDGTLVIKKSDSDVVIGNFDVDFGGDDRLTGSFKAEECDMSDWIWFF